MSTSPPSRFLTVQQFATELGVSRSAAYNLVQREGIATVKIGQTVRIERTVLEAFIAAGGER